jgi:hypothetical protein
VPTGGGLGGGVALRQTLGDRTPGRRLARFSPTTRMLKTSPIREHLHGMHSSIVGLQGFAPAGLRVCLRGFSVLAEAVASARPAARAVAWLRECVRAGGWVMVCCSRYVVKAAELAATIAASARAAAEQKPVT